MMLTFIAIVAALVVVYCIIGVGYCATRVPLTPTHKKQLESSITNYVVVLVLAALVFGFLMEKLLP